MSSIRFTLVFLMLVQIALVRPSKNDNSDYTIIQKIIDMCAINADKYSCLADKAAVIIEHLITRDVAVFDGISLIANKELRPRMPKQLDGGISRFASAIKNFLKTHTLKYDSSDATPCGGRLNDGKNKGGKGLLYVMWVIFGIFGITGPLVMHKMALMAATGLLASKTALLIAGSIAVKKLFEHNHAHSKFKVLSHSSNDDDVDRNMNENAYKYLNSL